MNTEENMQLNYFSETLVKTPNSEHQPFVCPHCGQRCPQCGQKLGEEKLGREFGDSGSQGLANQSGSFKSGYSEN